MKHACRRFNESYDDNKSGGYRDLSLNIEVLLRARAFVFIVKHLKPFSHVHTAGSEGIFGQEMPEFLLPYP